MKFTVTPMTCGSCVLKVTDLLQRIDANARVNADLSTSSITVDAAVSSDSVIAALAGAGYMAVAMSDGGNEAGTAASCCGTCRV